MLLLSFLQKKTGCQKCLFLRMRTSVCTVWTREDGCDKMYFNLGIIVRLVFLFPSVTEKIVE
ncbi:MAG TPA: hypothetical protein DF613_05000 [Lachnospiraceae bacterium]|nr:hypothetical protein [Lachnospiraceae bacterium]